MHIYCAYAVTFQFWKVSSVQHVFKSFQMCAYIGGRGRQWSAGAVLCVSCIPYHWWEISNKFRTYYWCNITYYWCNKEMKSIISHIYIGLKVCYFAQSICDKKLIVSECLTNCNSLRFDCKIISTSYIFCLSICCFIELNGQVCEFRPFSLSHIFALVSLGVLKVKIWRGWDLIAQQEANVCFYSERFAKQCTSVTQVSICVVLLQLSPCLVL